MILHETLDENATVDLALILTQDGIEDASEEPFEGQASVMWAAPTEDGRAMMGLRFTALAPEQAHRLKRFLSALSQGSAA